MDMRYGVNPHQQARVGEGSPQPVKLLNGSPSYINVLDALNAWPLVREARAALGAPVAASFKHVSPAGVAVAGSPDETMREVWGLGAGPVGPLTSAYVRARDADPKCSFGDMIAVSEPVDLELAEFLARVISDGIVAPGFEEGALEVLSRKKKGAFLVFEADPGFVPPKWERRSVYGMVLEQEQDALPITADCLTMTEGQFGPQAVKDALLGMITVRYTQSNSVAYLRDGMTLGIGAGQQSRVDCTKLAGAKAANWWMRRNPLVRELSLPEEMSRQDRLNWQIRFAEGDMTAGEWEAFREVAGDTEPVPADQRLAWGEQLNEVTLASDGFIPFRDNVDYAGRYGVRYIVEPGGSLRTPEVAAACRENGIALAHTGIRLFHH